LKRAYKYVLSRYTSYTRIVHKYKFFLVKSIHKILCITLNSHIQHIMNKQWVYTVSS